MAGWDWMVPNCELLVALVRLIVEQYAGVKYAST